MLGIPQCMRRLIALIMLLVIAHSTTITVPAVGIDGSGVTTQLTCEVNPGKGRILVATEPLIGLDTQQSEQMAVEIVTERLGTDLSERDVVFIFEANLSKSIDGASAGAAMALCLISELTGQEPNPQVSITGTILEGGEIGQVGGILAKARAVAETSSVFLIPEGQTITSTFIKNYYSPRPGIYIEEIEPARINVTEYAWENLGLSVVEVSNINEAEAWFFSGEVFAKEVPSFELPNFTAALPRMEGIAEYEIARAEKAVGSTNSSGARELLDMAINTPEAYPYTRANYAFLAYITAMPAYEDVESLANEFRKQLLKIETGEPTWRAEAEMRISWALFNEEFSSARKEWLMLGAQMLSQENFTGEVVDVQWVSSQANEKILLAKEELERARNSGAGINEAEDSLGFAIKSLENEMYFAALYNALDSIAWSRASETSSHRFLELLGNSTAFGDEFSEAYRRHAMFLASEGDFKGGAYSLFRAELRQDAFDKPLFTLPSFSLPSLDLKWLAIVILAYLAFRNKGAKRTELSQREEMALIDAKAKAVKELQNKLKKGEIGEKTYAKLVGELE